MKTKLALGVILMVNSLSVVAQECDFLKGLSTYQKEIAYKAYRAGYPHDLGQTMVAIAWKESKLGLYKVRMGYSEYDRSFGLYHTVAHWRTKDMTPFQAGRWVQEVIENDEVSIKYGLEDLLYWKARNKGDWYKMVGSYNGGSRPNNNYAEDVVAIVRQIKKCNI